VLALLGLHWDRADDALARAALLRPRKKVVGGQQPSLCSAHVAGSPGQSWGGGSSACLADVAWLALVGVGAVLGVVWRLCIGVGGLLGCWGLRIREAYSGWHWVMCVSAAVLLGASAVVHWQGGNVSALSLAR
jgi:hypothetical protein